MMRKGAIEFFAPTGRPARGGARRHARRGSFP